MKLSKQISILALVVFLCTTFPISFQNTNQRIQTQINSTIAASHPPPPALDPGPHILVYIEYADNTAGQEVDTLFTAITNTYGTDFTWTTLTDYTSLDTELPHHDILLIPEQENAYFANMTMVGTAWTSILASFIDTGGIVISSDGWSQPESNRGITARLVQAAGLFNYLGPYNPVGSPGTLNKVDANDALGQNASSSWTEPDVSVSYDAPGEGTIVVTDGFDSIVHHKILGKGHFVHIGFDFSSAEPNFATILANAIRLHRLIVIDASHTNALALDAELTSLRDDLLSNNFAVSAMNTFSATYLNACDAVVISEGFTSYSLAERTILTDFVAAGGGLFLVPDWDAFALNVNAIANEFGFNLELTSVAITDTDENTNGLPDRPIYEGTNIRTHFITQGVTHIEFVTGNGIIDWPAEAVLLIVSDDDSTSQWSNGTAAPSTPVYAALEYGRGRVVLATDQSYLTDDADSDGDGDVNYYDGSNEVLTMNTIEWLAENRAPNVTVISPNGGEFLEGTTNPISWFAFDPNNDLILGYDVSYSANNGGSWTSIVTGLTNTSMMWDVTGAPESALYLIRVEANDYGSTGQDASDAVFTVESQGPAISDIVLIPSPPLAGIPVTVFANVTDVSGVASVNYNYTSDGGGSWTVAAMTAIGGDTYQATIGPFESGVTVDYNIVAVDNSAASRTSISSTLSFTIGAVPPPIPGFPLIAIAIGAALALGIGLIGRHRIRKESNIQR